MRILITSGGTREPIDDVRYVGNRASGRTGSLLAEEAVRRFHTVFLLSGAGSVMPDEWAMKTGLLVSRTFGSAADLLDLCESLDYRFDAVIASAAVADFAPVKSDGKLSSAMPELVVRMLPTRKIVDRMRALWPKSVLVAFKLESNAGPELLFEQARRTMERCGADMVVANDTGSMGEESHPAHILDSSGRVCSVQTRRNLAGELIKLLENRCKA